MKFAKILPDVYVKIKLQNQDCIFWSRILLERISKSFESLKIWFRSLVIFWEEKTQNLKLYTFYHWIDEIRQNSPRHVREDQVSKSRFYFSESDSTREDFRKFWVTQNLVSFVGHFLRRKNTKFGFFALLCVIDFDAIASDWL